MWAWQTEKRPFTASESRVPLYLHSRRRRRLACLTRVRLIPITATSITIGRAGCRHRCQRRWRKHIRKLCIWQQCRLLFLRISLAFLLHFYFFSQPVSDVTDWLTAKPRGYRGRVAVCDWASSVSIITNASVYYRESCWRQQSVGDTKITKHVRFEENLRNRTSKLIVFKQKRAKIRASLYWAVIMTLTHTDIL